MTSFIGRAPSALASVDLGLPAMLHRKAPRAVTRAVANWTARVAWAMMILGGTYRRAACRDLLARYQ